MQRKKEGIEKKERRKKKEEDTTRHKKESTRESQKEGDARKIPKKENAEDGGPRKYGRERRCDARNNSR